MSNDTFGVLSITLNDEHIFPDKKHVATSFLMAAPPFSKLVLKK
jgi:hypothetical protein